MALPVLYACNRSIGHPFVLVRRGVLGAEELVVRPPLRAGLEEIHKVVRAGIVTDGRRTPMPLLIFLIHPLSGLSFVHIFLPGRLIEAVIPPSTGNAWPVM